MTAPLRGRRVLVTRPAGQADELCRLIRLAGGSALRYPTLEIAASAGIDRGRLLELVSAASHVVFISRNAVEYYQRLSGDLAGTLAGRQVYAAGEGTARELRERRVADVRASPGAGSDGLLALGELSPGRIRGADVLIIRGADGREHLKEVLERRGARVRYASVYTRRQPGADTGGPGQDGWPDVIVASSGRGLENLVEMTPPGDRQKLLATPLAVISPRLREAAVRAGFSGRIAVAPEQSDEGIMAAILQSMESSADE